MKIRIRHQPSGGREWVAELTGRHPKYKYERVFLKPVERDWSSSGKTGMTVYKLEAGKTYEINEPYEGRSYAQVVGDQVRYISIEEVEKYIESLEMEVF